MKLADIFPKQINGRLLPIHEWLKYFWTLRGWAFSLFSLLLLASLPVVLFYPALINADTLQMYMDAQAGGAVSNWHSALLVYVWRFLLGLGADIATFNLLDGMVYWAALLWLLRRAGLNRLQQLGLGLAIAVMPPVPTWLGAVEKTTITACIMCALFALAQAIEDRPLSQGRFLALLLLALFGVWLRPNGLALIGPVVLWAAWRRRGLSSALRYAVAPLFVALALGLPAAAVRYGIVLQHAPEQELFALDLMNMSMLSHRNLFPAGQITAPFNTAAAAMQEQPYPPFGGRFSMVTLRVNGMLPQLYQPQQLADLRHAWMNAILSNPLTYLHYRAALAWQFACFNSELICYDSWHWYTGGIDTPNSVGLRAHVWRPGFLFYRILAGSIFYRPWFHILMTLGILVGAVARRRWAVAVFAATLLLNVASYTLILPGISARMIVPVGLMLPPLLVALLTRRAISVRPDSDGFAPAEK